MAKKNKKKNSYAESLRKLKEAWNNEPVEFVGGIRLNSKKKLMLGGLIIQRKSQLFTGLFLNITQIL